MKRYIYPFLSNLSYNISIEPKFSIKSRGNDKDNEPSINSPNCSRINISNLKLTTPNSTIQNLSNRFNISSLLSPPFHKRKESYIHDQNKRPNNNILPSTSSNIKLCKSCGQSNHQRVTNRLCQNFKEHHQLTELNFQPPLLTTNNSSCKSCGLSNHLRVTNRLCPNFKENLNKINRNIHTQLLTNSKDVCNFMWPV